MKFISNAVQDTVNFAENYAKSLKSGDIIALRGEMGAGKTHFVRGLCKGLNLGDIACSPTFTLVNEYRDGDKLPLFHFDMYRVTGDPQSTGIDYYLEQEGIIVIEWFENIDSFITPNINIKIETQGENIRSIETNDFRG